MAMDIHAATRQLRRARNNLLYWQKELYLSRVAPKPSRERMRGMERQVLMHLTAVFNMQQCVKRLEREDHHRMMHWRAFI